MMYKWVIKTHDTGNQTDLGEVFARVLRIVSFLLILSVAEFTKNGSNTYNL
jgi:hypothetical protein